MSDSELKYGADRVLPGVLAAVWHDPDSPDVAVLLEDLPRELLVGIVQAMTVIAIVGWVRAAEGAGVDPGSVLGVIQQCALDAAVT